MQELVDAVFSIHKLQRPPQQAGALKISLKYCLYSFFVMSRVGKQTAGTFLGLSQRTMMHRIRPLHPFAKRIIHALFIFFSCQILVNFDLG